MLSATTVGAVDLGTSALKGIVLGQDGQIRAEGEVQLQISPSEHGQEQDAQAWWNALVQLVGQWCDQGADLTQLAALSLSGQMQDVLLTRDSRPLAPVILYSDTRAGPQAEVVSRQLKLDIEKATGNPYGAASILPKLLWLQQHQPQWLRGQPRLHLGAKDYLIERLCGAHVCDHTTAATTGLYDLERGQWFSDWLDLLQDAPLLPELRWPGDTVGTVSAGAAALCGLPAGLPLICGLGDAGATTLGAGVSKLGERYLYLGTSGWVGAITPRSQATASAFRLPLFNLAEVLTVLPLTNVGSAHHWAAATFAGGDYAALEDLLGTSPPLAGGVVCLPYLAGERSLINNPQAQGVFFGLTPATRPSDLARAVLEGVCFSLRMVSEALGPLAGERITLIGGGARSARWCQMLADILNGVMVTPSRPELLPVLGNASVAFGALGWVTSSQEFRASVLAKFSAREFIPNPGHIAEYQQGYQRFLRLYPALESLFDQDL